MAHESIKNFVGAARDLEDRARDYLDNGQIAHGALVIALKNFSVANATLEEAARAELERAGIQPPA